MNLFWKKIKRYISLSVKDTLIFFLSLFFGSVVCLLLQKISTSDVHVPIIFVLVVLVVSLLTEGYFYGILSAIVSVFAVNWAFTTPYMELNFTAYGYPLTFITLLAVGIACSTLTTRTREQQELKTAAAYEKARANLLRSVSHDLRTPLTSISGSLNAIISSWECMPESERIDLLKNARDDSLWLCQMMENLLSITRMSESGKEHLHKTEEALEEVLSDASHTFHKNHPNIKVSISVPDEVQFIPMDPILVKQVLLNIMNNASVHGKTTNNISICAKDLTDFVHVSICDDGDGIDSRVLEHLFSDHMLLDGLKGSDSNRFMGIGLTVCKTIIEAHGGKIYARNLPDRGAEFVFTLSKGDLSDGHP